VDLLQQLCVFLVLEALELDAVRICVYIFAKFWNLSLSTIQISQDIYSLFKGQTESSFFLN